MTENIYAAAFLAFENGASIDESRALFGCGRNKAIRLLKEYFGDKKYSELTRSLRSRGVLAAKKANTGRKHPPRSKEWCKKISKAKTGRPLDEAHKKSISKSLKRRIEESGLWLSEKQIDEKSEKARQTKIESGVYERWSKMIHPYRCQTVSLEGRQNMSLARKKFYAQGGKSWMQGKTHTDEVKKRLSEHTKRQWEEGLFDNNGLWRSKLEIRVFENLCERYSCDHSYRVRRKVFDVYVRDLNLLVEVNGDYWHLNPDLYDPDHYDKHRGITARDLWKRDAEKQRIAEENGFRTCTLWQKNLEENFEEHISDIIK